MKNSCFFFVGLFPVEIYLLMLNFEENSWLPPDLGDKLDYIASVVTTGDEQYVKKQTFFTNF